MRGRQWRVYTKSKVEEKPGQGNTLSEGSRAGLFLSFWSKDKIKADGSKPEPREVKIMPNIDVMYEAGNYGRCHVFPARRKGGKKKHKNGPTTKTMKKLNQKNAANKLSDLLNANFTSDDWELKLDYVIEPENIDLGVKDMGDYIREIRQFCRKTNIMDPKLIKYIYITEKGRRGGRIHHHLTINWQSDPLILVALWKKRQEHGYANPRPLEFDENGLRGLAHYVSNNPLKKRDTYRRWNCSKNLKRPEPKRHTGEIRVRDSKYMDAHPDDLQYAQDLFPGWIVTEIVPTARAEEDGSTYTGLPFLTIFMYKKDAVFGPKYYDALTTGYIKQYQNNQKRKDELRE
ncbi:MAG: hypothetical protein VB118_04735 [Oscillospiraceae bacterium]|nr:hypothetical protein [Oscillospiraceae bacterium]